MHITCKWQAPYRCFPVINLELCDIFPNSRISMLEIWTYVTSRVWVAIQDRIFPGSIPSKMHTVLSCSFDVT